MLQLWDSSLSKSAAVWVSPSGPNNSTWQLTLSCSSAQCACASNRIIAELAPPVNQLRKREREREDTRWRWCCTVRMAQSAKTNKMSFYLRVKLKIVLFLPNSLQFSFVEPYLNWNRIQQLCGSGSVFRLPIRIHTIKNRGKNSKKAILADTNSPSYSELSLYATF